MRTNLEHPRIYEPRLSGIRHANVVMSLSTTLIIPSDGPTVWVIDGGAGARTIRLPALSTDKQVVVANVGTTNNLNITDSAGNALVTIIPQAMAIIWGGTSRWVWIVDSFVSDQLFVTRVMTGTGAVLATDIEVQVNSAGVAVLTLPTAAAWLAASGGTGFPLSIFDISGAASTNNITINPAGAETISGNASLTINNDYGGWKLRPKAAGSAGWIFQ